MTSSSALPLSMESIQVGIIKELQQKQQLPLVARSPVPLRPHTARKSMNRPQNGIVKVWQNVPKNSNGHQPPPTVYIIDDDDEDTPSPISIKKEESSIQAVNTTSSPLKNISVLNNHTVETCSKSESHRTVLTDVDSGVLECNDVVLEKDDKCALTNEVNKDVSEDKSENTADKDPLENIENKSDIEENEEIVSDQKEEIIIEETVQEEPSSTHDHSTDEKDSDALTDMIVEEKLDQQDRLPDQEEKAVQDSEMLEELASETVDTPASTAEMVPEIEASSSLEDPPSISTPDVVEDLSPSSVVVDDDSSNSKLVADLPDTNMETSSDCSSESQQVSSPEEASDRKSRKRLNSSDDQHLAKKPRLDNGEDVRAVVTFLLETTEKNLLAEKKEVDSPCQMHTSSSTDSINTVLDSGDESSKEPLGDVNMDFEEEKSTEAPPSNKNIKIVTKKDLHAMVWDKLDSLIRDHPLVRGLVSRCRILENNLEKSKLVIQNYSKQLEEAERRLAQKMQPPARAPSRTVGVNVHIKPVSTRSVGFNVALDVPTSNSPVSTCQGEVVQPPAPHPPPPVPRPIAPSMSLLSSKPAILSNSRPPRLPSGVIDLTDEDRQQPATSAVVVPPTTTSSMVPMSPVNPTTIMQLFHAKKDGTHPKILPKVPTTKPVSVSAALLVPTQGSSTILLRMNAPSIGSNVTTTTAGHVTMVPGLYNTIIKGNTLPRVAYGPPRHPAPLPRCPLYTENPGFKLPPPKPKLSLSKVKAGIVLSWTMKLTNSHEIIQTYELYAYQETGQPPNTNMWKKVGDVRALPLPMACTLTQFVEGNKYHFAVRGRDNLGRYGTFSDPTNIFLTP